MEDKTAYGIPSRQYDFSHHSGYRIIGCTLRSGASGAHTAVFQRFGIDVTYIQGRRLHDRHKVPLWCQELLVSLRQISAEVRRRHLAAQTR